MFLCLHHMATCGQLKCPYMEISSLWKIMSSDPTNFDMDQVNFLQKLSKIYSIFLNLNPVCDFYRNQPLRVIEVIKITKGPANLILYGTVWNISISLTQCGLIWVSRRDNFIMNLINLLIREPNNCSLGGDFQVSHHAEICQFDRFSFKRARSRNYWNPRLGSS